MSEFRLSSLDISIVAPLSTVRRRNESSLVRPRAAPFENQLPRPGVQPTNDAPELFRRLTTAKSLGSDVDLPWSCKSRMRTRTPWHGRWSSVPCENVRVQRQRPRPVLVGHRLS